MLTVYLTMLCSCFILQLCSDCESGSVIEVD